MRKFGDAKILHFMVFVGPFYRYASNKDSDETAHRVPQMEPRLKSQPTDRESLDRTGVPWIQSEWSIHYTTPQKRVKLSCAIKTR